MSSGQGAQLISKGDKIAQILFVPVPEVEWEVVESVDNDTSRGEGGFGSSDESAV
jgi:dUTPase